MEERGDDCGQLSAARRKLRRKDLFYSFKKPLKKVETHAYTTRQLSKSCKPHHLHPSLSVSLSLSLPNSSKSSLPSLNWELERIIVSRNINERNKQHATSDECESLVLKEEWKHVRIEFDTSEGHHGILNFPLSYRLPIMAKVINKIK